MRKSKSFGQVLFAVLAIIIVGVMILGAVLPALNP